MNRTRKEDVEERDLRTSILTVSDLSALTGWKKGWIYKLTSRGELSFYKPNGKTIFFKLEEVEDYIFRNRSMSNSEMQGEVDSYFEKASLRP